MKDLSTCRAAIARAHGESESAIIDALVKSDGFTPEQRASAHLRATTLVAEIRGDKRPGLMEVFLAEYGLSTDEGVALMCLAEALLRVPDAETVDALIEDKIAPSEWSAHLGHSSSPLVNASTWALMLTGKVLREDGPPGMAGILKGAVKRLGEPVIRTAVRSAMKELGKQFVLGETIETAMDRARAEERKGFTYSYDMLGEAALTAADADAFLEAYAGAMDRISEKCTSGDVQSNPGLSIKLSALHPRFEEPQRGRVMKELVPRVRDLARRACANNMGFNIDAEEAERLELSLDVIEAVFSDPELSGWDGFGVVVQAYGKRAARVIDWLYHLAERHDRRIMVRLVKGAYWDAEIKRAQVEGLAAFPVFTRKCATDVAYLCCARRLLRLTGRIYPQFATHNAHTVAAILEVAEDQSCFEFQRLHGMGESLHAKVLASAGTRCRIYAPVGAHRDLLAYLVRRLLENGANSSFVNQIVDNDVPPEVIAADPFEAEGLGTQNPALALPIDLFAPFRKNSRGFDLQDPAGVSAFDSARQPHQGAFWTAHPSVAGGSTGGATEMIRNPANSSDLVGEVVQATEADVAEAFGAAHPWTDTAETRSEVLNRAADLYEQHHGEFFALLCREAGKTPSDAVSELREAVDFLRYYADASTMLEWPARGRFVCISPWNFPLAIFTGQISAALSAGNAVLAKPAEATPLVAARAVELLHAAGVPGTALQFLPGPGPTIGRSLAENAGIDGVAFTGSTATAQAINRMMAKSASPSAPIIAETGGLNAMIVDSTALPEQAVRDILQSAFQSAGQRCSALRVLYLQDDVADRFLKMLFGAMAELTVGDPWLHSTDIGPVIDARAKATIDRHIAQARSEGRVLHVGSGPGSGNFVAPTVIRINGIEELEGEVFGPILHVALFSASELDRVIDAINASGFGLTFGMHSRIDDRIQRVADRIEAGNLYINRNQIGAIVGSQPFGGQGLSGTGPKAGGPNYLPRFCRRDHGAGQTATGQRADPVDVQELLDRQVPRKTAISVESLPGPTGESNRLSLHPRGTVLCLGPDAVSAQLQAQLAEAAGCCAVRVAPGSTGDHAMDAALAPGALTGLRNVDAVAFWGDPVSARALRVAMANREGPILPLVTDKEIAPHCWLERHVCVDTTAAGGNASLLAAST